MTLRRRWVWLCALWLVMGCAHEATSDAKPETPSQTAAPARLADSPGDESRQQPSEGEQLAANPAPESLVESAPSPPPAAELAKPSKDKVAAAEKKSAGPAGSLSVQGIGAIAGGSAGFGRMGSSVARMAVRPASHIALDDGFDREAYAHIAEHAFTSVTDQALSTFSIDVDTASYSNVRRFIRDGQLPPADAVRIEELVNYFDYDYPSPDANEPFAVYAEVSDCPWNREHRLVHLGIQGKRMDAQAIPPRNLVFLIDVSGSMQDATKLPLLKRGMSLLARELRPQDRVSMVVYAGASGLVLPSTTGREQGKVLEALERLEAGGSTNGAAGIELAYAEAQRNFITGGINRVILATDGDFNVGVTSEGELVRLIEEKRKSGVFLTVLGFGTGNLQDSRMEQLADKGNGNYAYVDTIDEANKVLVREGGATLVTIAKDVKLQVEFNPAHVASYRLVGYENRALAARDFNDDKKDAGEIGAGHSVTALYEIVPAGSGEASAQPMVDPLRYQASRGSSRASESGELLTVKVRYKAPNADTSQLLVRPLLDHHRALRDTSSTFRFSAAVAGFGMLLRHSEHKGQANLPLLRELAESAVSDDPHGDKHELLDIMRAAQRLGLGS